MIEIKKLNSKSAGIVATYITFFFQIIASFVLTPLIIKYLGKSQYGVYQIALSVVSYLSILNFGIPHAYLRFHARYNGDKKERILNGTYIVIITFISLALLFCGLVATVLFTSPSLTAEENTLCKNIIFILTLNGSITMLTTVFDSYFTALEKFALNKVLACVQFVLSNVFSVLALYMGMSLYSVVLITLLVSFIKLIISAYLAKTKYNFKIEIAYDKLLIKELIAYSSLLFINLLSDQINWSLDRFLLGWLCGSNETAIYSVGSQILSFYMQILIAISAVFITKINDAVAKNESDRELSNLFIAVGRYQFWLAGLLIIGFVLFGKQFIKFWAGDGYEGAYSIALVLMISATPLYIQNIGTEIQRAKNLNKFRAYIYIAMCIINVFLSVILIKRYNGFGAACGTAIVVILGDGVIANIYFQKKVGLDTMLFWKVIIKQIIAISPTIVISFVIAKIGLPDTIQKDIPLIIAVVVTYVTSIIFIGCTKKERIQLTRFLKGVIRYGKPQ